MYARNLVLAGIAAALAGSAIAAGNSVAWPAGYRSWQHVKTMVIEQGHPLYASFGGMHHVYANKKAIEGYRSGHFKDGSVITLDLFEASSADHALSEGARKLLGVMVRNSRRYAATGGWGFEAFKAGDPAQRVAGADAPTACFACHASQKDHEYVFSRLRE